MTKGREIVDMGMASGIEGQWVVIYKDKVVASSEDCGEMLRAAEKYPSNEVTVTMILHAGASFY